MQILEAFRFLKRVDVNGQYFSHTIHENVEKMPSNTTDSQKTVTNLGCGLAKDQSNAYVLADEIVIGNKEKIPLCLPGFLS